MSKTKRKNMIKKQKEKRREFANNTKKPINKKAILIAAISLLLVVIISVSAVMLVNHFGKSNYKSPDFTVTNSEGKKVNLSDFEGKPVVLNFWATWCGYCIEEMPHFQEMYEKYDGKVEFIMLNLTNSGSETLEKAQQFIAEKGYSFPVYYDNAVAGGSVKENYTTSQIPRTYFIDTDGTLVKEYVGQISLEELEKQIKYLLDE